MCFSDLNYARPLLEKMQAEYDKFIELLTRKGVKAAIDAAYEITCKDEILMIFESKEDFVEDHHHALLEMQYPLDFLYNLWLETDISVVDDLMASLKSHLDYQFPVTHFERGVKKCLSSWDISFIHCEHLTARKKKRLFMTSHRIYNQTA